MPKPKQSLFYRSAEFALSLKSWKRTVTVPFKRMGGYGQTVKERVALMYTRHDNLVPATSEEEVLLAIKKAKSNAIINLCFAIGVGTLAITRVQIASPLQTATCLAVMLVFSLRFVVDIFIVVRGNDQISRQYYPTIEVEDEPGENTNA